MNFWHLVRVVKYRIYMVLAVVAATLLVVVVAAPRPKVVYQAIVDLKPTQQVMMGGSSTAGNTQHDNAPDRLVTLSDLIILAKSGAVMQRALDFLALSEDEQRRLSPGWMEYRQVPQVLVDGKPLDFGTWNDILDVRTVDVASVGNEGTTTNVIRVFVTMENGDIAPYLANAVGYAVAEAYKDQSKDGARKSAAFLESSLEENKTKLRALQSQIAAYKTQHSVVAVDAETQSSLTALAGFESAREQAAAEAREASAALQDINRQLRSQPLVSNNSLPAQMNPKVIQLQEDLAKEEANLRDLAQKYKPAHPLYAASQTRIQYLKGQIAEQGRNYSQPVINEVHLALVKQQSEASYRVATAKAKLASLSASVGRAQAKIDNLAKAEPELINLMTDYARLDSSYKLIAEKLAQTRIAEKETTTTGSIITQSWAPFPAIGPNSQGPSRKLLMVYGFFLSLVLAIALAVWLDSIDNRLRNAADVEKLLELPVLGLTPKLTGRDGNLPNITHMYPLSAMAESYKILRTNILFAMRDNPFKTLMVATGRPGQGATTTVCNLAIALAQIGKRIILIDADMRRPSLHKFFGVPNEAGLSTLLQGTGNVTDAFQTTDIPNLILVPAGPQPLNPSELIGSERMQEVVARLEEHCDLVMFDTPSTIVFSDGPMLASWLDAVIMIVSANQAPRGSETVTRDLLRRAKANILGVVVNRMSPENVDSCYYYSHYYSDSVPAPHTAQLGPGDTSGNGKKAKPGIAKATEAKAIPAASAERTDAAVEDNPFPD